MTKRIRSPNYPAISLPAALEKLHGLWSEIETQAASREVVARGLGYTSLHGASITMMSALTKYGLVDRAGDDLKISERGMICLYPKNKQEFAEAIRNAAMQPPVFAELREQFADLVSSDEALSNFLLRKGFAKTAVPSAILAYRETMALVAKGTVQDDKVNHDPGSQFQEAATGVSLGNGSPGISQKTMVPAKAGKFSATMTDEMLVDIVATELDRVAVSRLIVWLQTIEPLVPETRHRNSTPESLGQGA